MPRRIAQERVPTASNVGSCDVTWTPQPTLVTPLSRLFACFAGPILRQSGGRDRTSSEGQVKYCRCTFFGHAMPNRAGARPASNVGSRDVKKLRGSHRGHEGHRGNMKVVRTRPAPNFSLSLKIFRNLCDLGDLCVSQFPGRRGDPRKAVTKEVVGIHVLLTRSLFACDILRRLLLRVSLAKPTSAPLRF